MRFNLLRCSSNVSCVWNWSWNAKGWEALLSSAHLLPVLSDNLAAQSGLGYEAKRRQRQAWVTQGSLAV